MIERDAPPDFRTFKPRRRQLTPARADLLDRLAPAWCADEVGGTIDLAELFGRRAPVVLEIGIGLGESLTTMAERDPATDVIGVDVHTPGIASSLARIESSGLRNVRLVHGDALGVRRAVSLRRHWPGSASSSPTPGPRCATATAGS